jgi:hypothetical protein
MTFEMVLTNAFFVQCGEYKKGHVCPYQPVVKRNDAAEVRNAAVQVEMDEVSALVIVWYDGCKQLNELTVLYSQFMAIRRLNLQIQGFPESYASEPNLYDNVVGEPHPPDPHRPMDLLSINTGPRPENPPRSSASPLPRNSPTSVDRGMDNDAPMADEQLRGDSPES